MWTLFSHLYQTIRKNIFIYENCKLTSTETLVSADLQWFLTTRATRAKEAFVIILTFPLQLKVLPQT